MGYEQAEREQAMERARRHPERLEERVASGRMKRPEKIGAAVERVMQKYHGYRYFDGEMTAEGWSSPRARSGWVAGRRSRANMW
jgi:hypothetical protein